MSARGAMKLNFLVEKRLIGNINESTGLTTATLYLNFRKVKQI